MKFGPVESRSAEGCILAHATQVGGSKLPKGRCLTSDDVERLLTAGIDRVIVARLDPGDLPEDEAAAAIADALATDEIGASPAATGRANLFAGGAGVFIVDRRVVDAINRVHPGITLATLNDYASVEVGRMVATVKIIPLAVPRSAVEAVADLLAGGAAFHLRPFRGRGVGLVQTVLPGMKPSVLDKTASVLAERLKRTGSHILREDRVGHEEVEVRLALSQAPPDEAMTIVFGASAVIDENDVIPAAIRLAGGRVDHLGMPVDPGNLLLLGQIGERIVIGAPGCARSPRENGFDWVLDRVLADLPVSSQELTGLGVGGLLMEIASRPQPREINRLETRTPRIAIVVLAAGRSSRMGGPNKLMASFDGKPLLRRSVETALASRAVSVHVVLGHRSSELRRTIEGFEVVLHDNPDFADGLSTSLKRGFEAASEDADGVLVMLADQPLLTSSHLDALIAAFEPSGEGSIVLACDGERRANPVILSSGFREEIGMLQGDVGARHLVQQHRDLVREIDIGPAASFDVDTPELMERAGGVLPPA